MDPGSLFILESFLAYLISMAAGLRTSAIGDKAQQRLKRDLESIRQKIQDQNHSRSFQESLELLPIDVAKLKHRLKDAFIDGPVTNLCVDEQFQKGITDYFLEKDTRARNALEKQLKADIVAAFLDAGATKGQAGYNGDRFFELIQRRLFKDQVLINFLLYGEIRHVSEQQERHTEKLDAIHRDIKQFGETHLPLQRPRRAEHFTGREQELESIQNSMPDYGSKHSAMLERIYATLPSRHDILYGRGKELDDLVRLLSRESPIKGVAVQAIGGMGKTALARECCIGREIWKPYDVVLGAQALKRQMGVDARSPMSSVVHFDRIGTILQPWELLVTIAGQLGVRNPKTRTETDLEKEVVQRLDGQRALIVLDNLETIENIVDVLALLDRICSPPIRRALITTRRFPEDHSEGFVVLPLHEIKETAACRELVIDRLRRYIDLQSVPDEAVAAIVEVGQGHPLALELLTGKLVTQGTGAILKLRDQWTSNTIETLNEEFLSALCNYVFDDRFLEHIGSLGADLLSVIALEDAGVDEEAARYASGLSNEEFDATLTRLFEAGCIRRELYGDLSVLAMHSITQAYFRAVSI